MNVIILAQKKNIIQQKKKTFITSENCIEVQKLTKYNEKKTPSFFRTFI